MPFKGMLPSLGYVYSTIMFFVYREMSGDVAPHSCPNSASFVAFCHHLINGLTKKKIVL